MIGIYLLPYPVRGIAAPYLWIFYKWLTTLRERALFLVGEDYLLDPEALAAQDRWELRAISCETYGYQPPTGECLARHDVRTLPKQLFFDLLAECHGNPVELFRRMLTERLPSLEEAVDRALADASELEAVITWCNCPSLSAVAARRGIPVVHLEVGPLRAPLYRPTAYLDFSGVNGNTEAARRFDGLPTPDREFPLDLLRRYFFLHAMPPKDSVARVGLALQVEDDSNLVAFGRGFDNQATLSHARLRYAHEGPIAVRSHPGSLFKAKGDWFEADRSHDSLAFIQRCGRIVTINSSLGFEALLLGTPVTMLGDSSFGFIFDAPDERQRLARLAFYLFGYLIPEVLEFDVDYLRFRLSGPQESAVVARHVACYQGQPVPAQEDGSVWHVISAALARQP